VWSFINLLKNHLNEYNVDSSLFTSWYRGVGSIHNRGKPYLHVFTLNKKSNKTSRPISIKVGTNNPWLKEILNCWNKGPGPLKRGDNKKMQKLGGFI
jgi:hypothetical protein